MSRHTDTLRKLLEQRPMTASQLAEDAGISQPTVSRALKSLGTDIVRVGAGPSIQYALQDGVRGIQPSPIYQVSAEGKIHPLGTLIPVRPSGFVIQRENGTTLYSEGLPWWLFDMRPQGYLGRAYASVYAAGLNLPLNPEHWNDTDVIRALLAHGQDSIGNLLIGEKARERFIALPTPVPVNRTTTFPELARAIASGEVPGSSAGGEQPKFCAYTEQGHVLIKFSAQSDNPVSERWRDLLLAEHLALAVLGVKTEVYDIAGQRFLEVPRFDRIGPFGRVGVFSLRALDMEFVGDALASWPILVSHLATAGHVQTEAIRGAALLWAFGCLIGNTDMHAGNLSFISNNGRPYQLAPAYDMLPMSFAPRSSGAIIDSLSPASLIAAVPSDTWREALQLANRYIAVVRDCDGFSDRFYPCIEALQQHIGEAEKRIARLG